MTPARAKDSQTAEPATSPAVPSSEKMPAPTIAATPMDAACPVLMYFRGAPVTRRTVTHANRRDSPESGHAARFGERHLRSTTPSGLRPVQPPDGARQVPHEAEAGDDGAGEEERLRSIGPEEPHPGDEPQATH